MSDYIFTADPKSKGLRLVIYDKAQDIFYTAPRHIIMPPPNMQRSKLDDIKDCWVLVCWLMFFVFAWIFDDFIRPYIANKYIYSVLTGISLFLGNKIFHKGKAVCPFSQCTIEGKE